MRRRLYKMLNEDRKIFRKLALDKNEKYVTISVLTEHYPMLERCTRLTGDECKKIEKKIKDPELLPGLFDRCTKMCEAGLLPDSSEIINFFKEKISGTEIQYLPIAITGALLHITADGAMKNDIGELKNAIKSIQKMREFDYNLISEKLFQPEGILKDDVAEIYQEMSSETKAEYRRKISLIAHETGKSDIETAIEIFRKSKNEGNLSGNYLFSTVYKNK